MKVIKLPDASQDTKVLQDILNDYKIKTYVFAAIDVNGEVIIHVRGDDQCAYEYCGLLKFLERRINSAIEETWPTL